MACGLNDIHAVHLLCILLVCSHKIFSHRRWNKWSLTFTWSFCPDLRISLFSPGAAEEGVCLGSEEMKHRASALLL